jgi:hypothetical protein
MGGGERLYGNRDDTSCARGESSRAVYIEESLNASIYWRGAGLQDREILRRRGEVFRYCHRKAQDITQTHQWPLFRNVVSKRKPPHTTSPSHNHHLAKHLRTCSRIPCTSTSTATPPVLRTSPCRRVSIPHTSTPAHQP